MAKRGKADEKLYSRMRDGGIRKKVARQLAELPGHVSGKGRAPKPVREAVDRLEAAVADVRGHTSRSDRKASARKAAWTRKANAKKRSASARKGARKRAKA